MSLLAGKRVLVVEDEALVAAMTADMLRDLGAEVIGPAPTVAAGLERIAAGGIDLAVLDVNIRGARITPVAEALRAAAIPFVFATGYGEGAAALGFDAPILDKPYTRERLAAAAAKALQR